MVLSHLPHGLEADDMLRWPLGQMEDPQLPTLRLHPSHLAARIVGGTVRFSMAIIEIQPPEIMAQDLVAILTLDKTGMEVL